MEDENAPARPDGKTIQFLSDRGFVRADGTIKWRSLCVRMALLLALAIGIFGGAAVIFRKHLHLFDRLVSETMGLGGVALFVFVVDTLIVPATADIIFPFAAHWNPALFVSVVGAASVLAGMTGYWIGRLLGKTNILKKLTGKFSEDGKRMIERYGALGVVIGALTPIPYSTTVWLAGVLKVPYWKVCLACLCRLIRMALYYLMVTGTLVAVFG